MIRKNLLVIWVEVMICLALITACGPISRPSVTPNNSPLLTSEPEPEVPTVTSVNQWDVETSTDEMTGEMSAYTYSPNYYSTQQMGSPYDDVEAWIGVGCRKGVEWAYIGFSTSPNLVNTDIEDGYDRISTRVKWNDSIESVILLQEWGDRFLMLSDDADVIQKLQTKDTLLLELEWYGEGTVYFKFPLTGAKEGIGSMRSMCGN